MRSSVIAVAAVAALGALGSCAVSGPGYDGYGGVDVGYVGDYWEPWGYDYGGWGGHYHVGPPRGDAWHEDGAHPARFGDARHGPGGHAGGGRAAPSIPRRPR